MTIADDDGPTPLAATVGTVPVFRASALFGLEVDRHRRAAITGASVDRRADGSVTVRGTVEQTALSACWSALRLGAHDVWEFSLELVNAGDRDVALSRLDPFAAGLAGDDWATLAFRSAWGDEFRPETAYADGDLFFESRAGRSSHGFVPWVGFERPGVGFVVAPVWSGNWHIDVTDGGVVSAGISDWLFETTLAPGESVRAPSVLVAFGPDRDEAAIGLTSALGDGFTPRSEASERLDVEWNHWWPYEDVGVDEGVIAENAGHAVRAGIRQVTVDAGWFGPADGGSTWTKVRGDWDQVNTVRFPSGLGALGGRIRATGARPGIWIEAEAVGVDSLVRRERPEIIARAVDGRRPDRSYRAESQALDADDPTFLGYVCCGSESGRRFVAESLDRVVEVLGAEWIKLDFNIDPDAGCTRTDHGHGSGDGLFRHYLGLYSVLDEFRRRHPEVVLESCASGGLRLDLGMARHVHCIHLSDPDYTEHALHVLWGASMMLPPATMLHWSWSQWRGEYAPAQLDFGELSADEFAATLRAAMLHRFGVSLRLPELRPDLADVLAEHVGVYTATVAALVREGILRRLSGQPLRHGRGERRPAFQLSSRDGSRHLVAVFSLPGADDEVARIRPRALEAERSYRVSDPFGAAATISTGAELSAAGIVVPESAGRLTSRFVLIDRIQTSPRRPQPRSR